MSQNLWFPMVFFKHGCIQCRKLIPVGFWRSPISETHAYMDKLAVVWMQICLAIHGALGYCSSLPKLHILIINYKIIKILSHINSHKSNNIDLYPTFKTINTCNTFYINNYCHHIESKWLFPLSENKAPTTDPTDPPRGPAWTWQHKRATTRKWRRYAKP